MAHQRDHSRTFVLREAPSGKHLTDWLNLAQRAQPGGAARHPDQFAGPFCAAAALSPPATACALAKQSLLPRLLADSKDPRHPSALAAPQVEGFHSPADPGA